MTITTEEAEQMAEICDQLGGFAQCAAALRSLAAERDALKAENKKLRAALLLARVAVSHACKECGRLIHTQDLVRIDAALGEKG